MNKHPVIIVGGGLSGLAAGVSFAQRGIAATILEQKPNLGGRAYSFRDARTGETIDNGQHILLAGYRGTIQFLETIGSRNLLLIQPRPQLQFHHPSRGFQSITVPAWNSPTRLATGILGSGLFSLGERWRLVQSGRAMLDEPDEALKDKTINEWLAMHNQSAGVRESFWEPLAISIMNERPAAAAALPFARALRDAFLGSWEGGRLAVPRVGLSQLYVDQAREFILRKGGSIHCNADVAEVCFNREQVSGVSLKDGQFFPCSALILSVPPYRIPSLIHQEVLGRISLTRVEEFEYSPILSTHLWFERDVMDIDFVGLIRKTTQWVFNKRRLLCEKGDGGHLSTVISAAHDLVTESNDEIIHITLDDLRSVFGSHLPKLVHGIVVREKRATVSITPSLNAIRPSQKTAIPNFFLAGDWTQTGYPATIEGAVLSGQRCAELAARYQESPLTEAAWTK